MFRCRMWIWVGRAGALRMDFFFLFLQRLWELRSDPWKLILCHFQRIMGRRSAGRPSLGSYRWRNTRESTRWGKSCVSEHCPLFTENPWLSIFTTTQKININDSEMRETPLCVPQLCRLLEKPSGREGCETTSQTVLHVVQFILCSK